MARPEVYDSTALIAILRDREFWRQFQRKLAGGHVWLSSVVVAEMYAGTRSQEDADSIGLLGSIAAKDRRLLTPTHGDWVQAGRLIDWRARLAGAIRPRDHLADVLIVVSAATIGATIVTANVRHFETWARLARAAALDVTVSQQSSC